MGPFFFAWVDADETAFTPNHWRVDEEVLSFTVSQAEGDFAQLDIIIKNPKVAFLTTTRKVWAWLSYNPEWRPNVPHQISEASESDDGDSDDAGEGSFQFDTPSSQEVNTSNIRSLFFGRLVGIPTSINQEAVTLTFSARPIDFPTRKILAGEALKVSPYYDPIWISPANLANPDTVLEGYTALWHIDRITGDVTASDVILGEDGNESFSAAEVPYDSVKITLAQTPLQSVTVDGQVGWTQQAKGQIDGFGTATVDTYTGQSLMADWPKVGASLGGGWTVVGSSIGDVYDVANVKVFSSSSEYQNQETQHETGDVLTASQSSSVPQFKGPYLSCGLTGFIQTGILDPDADPPVNIPAKGNSTSFYIGQSKINTTLTLEYVAARQRTEHVHFTLFADVQPLVTLPEGQDSLQISLTSSDVGTPISADSSVLAGQVPIIDVKRSSYFPTGRGQLSLEYLICVARANLVIRARAVSVSFDCTFERAINCTLRKTASIVDDRLPGGNALGKIVSYTFGADGSNGVVKGSVTIGCALGRDGSVDTSDGTPDYVDLNYVDSGYQEYSDQLAFLSDSGDTAVAFSPARAYTNDDGLHFPLSKSTAGLELWHGSIDDQVGIITGTFLADAVVADLSRDTAPSPATQLALANAQNGNTETVIKGAATWYELDLVPVDGGPFNGEYEIVTSVLKIPRQINLEV